MPLARPFKKPLSNLLIGEQKAHSTSDVKFLCHAPTPAQFKRPKAFKPPVMPPAAPRTDAAAAPRHNAATAPRHNAAAAAPLTDAAAAAPTTDVAAFDRQQQLKAHMQFPAMQYERAPSHVQQLRTLKQRMAVDAKARDAKIAALKKDLEMINLTSESESSADSPPAAGKPNGRTVFVRRPLARAEGRRSRRPTRGR